MTARFAVQWTAVCRIKLSATAVADHRAQQLFGTLCVGLGVHRAGCFLKSRLAEALNRLGRLLQVALKEEMVVGATTAQAKNRKLEVLL